MTNYFDSFCQEGNAYIKHLAEKLGYPENKQHTIHLLKSTLHTIRDRITLSQSLHILAQLPSFLKVLYIDQWSCHPKPPLHYKTVEEFLDQVKEHQKTYREQVFDWNEDTENLVKIILNDLREKYLSEGTIDHLMCQLPKEVQDIFNTGYRL